MITSKSAKAWKGSSTLKTPTGWHRQPKVTQLDLDGPKELSRREREEIEKQKAKERYMKMHLAGKTEQAKADLARLAIIRKQREEAARKKEEERKAKDDATLSGKRMQSLSLNK